MSPDRANLFWCVASAINMLHLRRSAGPISTLHRCCEAQCVPFNAHPRRSQSGGYIMLDVEVDLSTRETFPSQSLSFQTSGRAVSEPGPQRKPPPTFPVAICETWNNVGQCS